MLQKENRDTENDNMNGKIPVFISVDKIAKIFFFLVTKNVRVPNVVTSFYYLKYFPIFPFVFFFDTPGMCERTHKFITVMYVNISYVCL